MLELALFGSVFIFIVGAIIRQSASSGLQQNQQLRAFRIALADSHMYSEGLKGTVRGTAICGAQLPGGPLETSGGRHGEMSRNMASTIILEDRLNVGSAKNAEIDRTPYIAQGSGTHSRNLFMPFDYGECHNIAVMDVYINGRHFPFITADFVEVVYTFGPEDEDQYAYESVPNHSAFADKWDATDEEAFDLNRDGVFDENIPASMRQLRGTSTDDNPQYFSWQWHKVSIMSGALEGSMDIDGDLKEEAIMDVDRRRFVDPEGIERLRVTIKALDHQEGDIDFSVNDYDKKNGAIELGLQRDMYLYTDVSEGDGGDEGTYLQIEEGQLIDGISEQVVRSVQRKDQIDVVQRRFILSRNTGRFCSYNDYAGPVAWEGATNPVEVCCRDTSCCFRPGNVDKTCMAPSPEMVPDPGGAEEAEAKKNINHNPVLYIRTRIEDRRGRKWITNINDDPTVGYSGTVYSNEEESKK